MSNQYHSNKVLLDSLKGLFDLTDGRELDSLLAAMRIIAVKGGDYLMRKDEEADSMFLVISGRMLAIVPDSVGAKNVVGEISRGESVGEMALINEGAKRTADVFAIRDSVLAEITKEVFLELIKEYPRFLLNISRLVVNRLQKQLTFQKRPNSFVVFAMFHAERTDAVLETSERICEALRKQGNTLVVKAEDIDAQLNEAGISNSDKDEDRHRISILLNDMESECDYILLQGKQGLDHWNQLCLRQSDYGMILADVNVGTQKRPIDILFDGLDYHEGWNIKLVLIHDHDTHLPTGTKAWYDDRNINGHHHIRRQNDSDISRMVRFICGRSNGLVLSGGGAKGMAHVGVYKALQESDIVIDYVSGTSIGSVMAALIAMDLSAEELTTMAEDVFLSNPTPMRDFNFMPFYSLLSGKKIDRLLQEAYGDIQIEDLWIPFFCVSSDLTASRIRLHEQGALWKAVRASIALPGVFPPVIMDQHVLVDGVVFNNIPVDIMVNKGVGNVLGVNLDTDVVKKVNVDELPKIHQRWYAKLTGKHKYENLPNMMETIARSTFAMSENRSRDHFKKIDLFFIPPVAHFGLMDWKSFHKISELGYIHAKEKIEECEDLERFKG